MIKIDRKLNLVFVIDHGGSPIHVHAMPISREIFEQHFLIISKTFAALYSEGLNSIAGPRVASLLLRQIAENVGIWDGRDGVRNTLINEIRRLANVVVPGEKGWESLPLEDAITRGMMDEDEISEVEGVLVFFMCCSAMHRKKHLPDILGGMHLWDTSTTFSNVTDYTSSLKTPIKEGSTGETAVVSSATS